MTLLKRLFALTPGNRIKTQRPTGQESEEEDGRPVRRLRRKQQADAAVLVGNVPKTVRISEFKAKVSLCNICEIAILEASSLIFFIHQGS